MKRHFLFCLLLFVGAVNTAHGVTYTVSRNGVCKEIGKAIKLAAAGDTVLVMPGHFTEHSIIIDRPVTLLAQGNVILDGQDKIEIITVKADHVLIKGFSIINSGNQSMRDIAGIKVLAANYVTIENNKVQHCNFGIYLSNTRHCIIRNNTISGNAFLDKSIGNGIHVWKADSVTITGNHSELQRDGIYFEFVTNSQIRNNISENNMRYGLHFMFSHSNTYTSNRFHRNGAGVAVMYSHHVHMRYNSFDHNWGSAAYGILLKDITDSEIENNKFNYNSAGIYMEGSNRIQMRNNTFQNNGWALRIQASCTDNIIEKNNFSGNTFDVATNGETQLNHFKGNYWDKYEGYDLNRDGTGDVAYRPVSLFSMIVEQLPPGLLFVRSFMVYLLDKAEKIIPSLTPVNLYDEQPSMRTLTPAESTVASLPENN